MSEMFSRRVFLRGLGVVAAAAALTACSSTNEAVNQALIEGAVGGIVAADCKIDRSRYWAANAAECRPFCDGRFYLRQSARDLHQKFPL